MNDRQPDEGATSTPAGTGDQPDGRGRPAFPVRNPRVIGLLIAIFLVGMTFSILNPNFLTVRNMLGMVRAMSSLGLLALGLTLVIIVGELDLSIGAIYGFTAMLAGTVWIDGVHVVPALLIGLGAGVFVGFLNGALTTWAGIPSFIVTLGMLNAVEGVTLLISGARGINPKYAEPPVPAGEWGIFRALGATKLPLDIPVQVVWLAGLGIVFWVLLHRTLFGFRLAAIGSNTPAARAARLSITRHKFIAFMLGGAMAAVAGMLDFSFLGSTDPSAGRSLLFPVFAAVIVGGATLTGGRATIIGTLVGALLLSVLSNGLSIIGVGAFAKSIFIGTATIGAVMLDRFTYRKRARPGQAP